MSRWPAILRALVIGIAVVGVVTVGVRVLTDDAAFTASATPLASLLPFALLSIAVQMVAQWLRSYKQRLLLEEIRPVRTTRVFEGQMIGFLFNSILPFRLGELVRAHYIGRAISISRSAVFATILFERLVDSVILVVAGLAMLVLLGQWVPAIVSAVVWIAVLASILGVLLFAARVQQRLLLVAVSHSTAVFNTGIRDRLRMIAWSVVYTLRTVVTRRSLGRYLLLSVTMWVVYLGSVLLFVTAVLPSLGFIGWLRTSLASFLSVSVPSGPAYLGTYGDVFAATSGVGGPLLATSGIALATWAIITLPSTAIGLVLLLTRQFAPRGSAGDRTTALENKLYRDADITSEFSHYLDAYFRNDTITKILSAQEFRGRFKVLRTFKGGSNALTMLASEDGRTVVKKVTLPQYGQKLIDQYEWLAERESYPEVAQVVGPYEAEPDHVSINIEFRPEFRTFFEFIHSTSVEGSRDVIERVWDFMSTNVYRDAGVPGDRDERLRSYIDSKVLQKAVDASKSSLELTRLLSYDELVVNGRRVLGLESVLQRIQSDPRMLADLAEFDESPIHGDLTVDNLMVDPHTGAFLMLDPNNENAISDRVVDAGKLMQSLHSGYEFLVGLTEVSVQGNAILFEENRSEQYAKLDSHARSLFEHRLDPARFRSLLFHEAVHYFRMLTYRVQIDSATAPAFFAVAVRLLDDYVGQYDSAAHAGAAGAEREVD